MTDAQDDQLRNPNHLSDLLYDNSLERVRHALRFVAKDQWDRLLQEAQLPEKQMRIVE